MSGSPKYSRAQLEAQRQAKLEAERRRKAEAEAQRRREAEVRERQRQFENRRKQVQQSLQAMNQRLAIADAYPQDIHALQQESQTLKRQLAKATNEAQVQSVLRPLEQLERELTQAIARKRRDDQEKKRLNELAQQQGQLEELERALAEIPEAAKFDAAGQQAVRQVIQNIRATLNQGEPLAVRERLMQGQQQLAQHEATVYERRTQWQQRHAQAETALGELQALWEGLQADEVLRRWCALESFKAILHQAEAAMSAEQFEQVAVLLEQLQTQSQGAIAQANAAQLKADKRDLIADSMAQVLQDMGFVVQQGAEHPDHPASAVVLVAANNAGKGISVSVPVEGEVFYDVEGYPKNLAAAVCDEAETVLNEMHEILAAEFGIQMGEVMWEGKPPHRHLRGADELPRNRDQQSRKA